MTQRSPDQPEPSHKPAARSAADERAEASSWHRLAGVGVEFIAALIVPGLIGHWLDGKLGTGYWLMLAGGGLGFAAGLMLLVRAANRSFRD